MGGSTMCTQALKLADVLGRSLVVHEAGDSFTSRVS
jgi:hypothetical protein